ncbi:MAG: hypothetical protein LBT31_03730 [Synergistaceae bacterium]|nr:hypothetical protein [Synergistaceae bacterium]
MKLRSFAVKIDQNEAEAMSKKRMSFFGRLLIGKNPEVEIKTFFIENKIITYEITNEPPFFINWLRKGHIEKHKSRIRMIADGSTSGVALYDDAGTDVVDMDVDEKQVQLSDFSDDMLVVRGNVLARRILRRRVGGAVSLETLEIQSVFRPYHVLFYGKLTEGRKVRYMSIPADNCVVKKTF